MFGVLCKTTLQFLFFDTNISNICTSTTLPFEQKYKTSGMSGRASLLQTTQIEYVYDSVFVLVKAS